MGINRKEDDGSLKDQFMFMGAVLLYQKMTKEEIWLVEYRHISYWDMLLFDWRCPHCDKMAIYANRERAHTDYSYILNVYYACNCWNWLHYVKQDMKENYELLQELAQ